MTETATPAGGPPAGWYTDPAGSGGERWWNGTGWAETTRPKQPAPPSAPMPTSEPVAILAPESTRVSAPGPHAFAHDQHAPAWQSAPTMQPAPVPYSPAPAHVPTGYPGQWVPSAGYPAPRPTMSATKRALMIVGIVVGSFFAVSILAAIAIPVYLNQRHHVVTGTLVVNSSDGCLAGSAQAQPDRADDLANGKTFPCPDGPGGDYADIHDGAQVVLRDGRGAIVATGELASGTMTQAGEVWTFTVPDVPMAQSYVVDVADRGGLTFTRAELVHNDWNLSLTVG